MKTMKAALAILSLAGNMRFTTASAAGVPGVSTRAETLISKDVFANGSYCHAKFETIRDETLASSQPVLEARSLRSTA